MKSRLKVLQIPRQQPFPFQYAAGTEYRPRPQPSAQPTSDHLAQKEFLEQTPWANPQHPIHLQSRTPSAFGSYSLGASNVQAPMMGTFKAQASSPFATPMLGGHRRLGNDTDGLGSSDALGMPSEPPSSVIPAPPTQDRIQLIDRTEDESPTAQAKRAAGPHRVDGKRDFSGKSSASTIDVTSDPAVETDHAYSASTLQPQSSARPSASHTAFATSALHGQHVEERRPDLYDAAAEFRAKMGGFGTPLPLGSRGISAGLPGGMEK